MTKNKDKFVVCHTETGKYVIVSGGLPVERAAISLVGVEFANRMSIDRARAVANAASVFLPGSYAVEEVE